MESDESTSSTFSSTTQSLGSGSGSGGDSLYVNNSKLVPFDFEDDTTTTAATTTTTRAGERTTTTPYNDNNLSVNVPKIFTFSPFPKYSVNIVTGPTSVGKTYFVTQLINNYKYFFDSRVDRVVVILCNSRVKSIAFDEELDVPVEQVLLSDFIPDHLVDNDLVIIDDLQYITPDVKMAISVCAHHQSLASLFVITHALLGTKNFELLSLCHRVLMFLGSTANHRLTGYILDRFFTDPDKKAYLKSVLNFCSNENEILALELSPVGHTPQILVAFSHLQQLIPDHDEKKARYCFAYPTPYFGEKFGQRFVQAHRSPVVLRSDKKNTMSVAFVHSDSTRNLPAHTLIALPAQFVVDQINTLEDRPKSTSATECADREAWDTMLHDVEDNIQDYFPLKRWKVCKNLAKEILTNSKFCITKDGKSIHLVDQPSNSKVNLISFIGLVTRRAGPGEKPKKEWSIYTPLIRQLIRDKTPKELFVNKVLLEKSQQNSSGGGGGGGSGGGGHSYTNRKTKKPKNKK